jgi:hypothetical protein
MSSALRLLLGSVSWPSSMAELTLLIRLLTGHVVSDITVSLFEPWIKAYAKLRDVLAVVFFYRRDAKGAESHYFLFAAERPANKKIQALRAKRYPDIRFAWFHSIL